MPWESLVFSGGDPLTGSEMNVLQGNFSAMAAGNSGSPAIDVNSLVATGVASLTSVIISSLFTAEVVSAKQVTVDSGIQADIGSFNQLEVNSLAVDSGMSLIDSDLSEDGYTYLPNGLIMQWVFTVSITGIQSYAFPLTFPNSTLSIIGTTYKDEVTPDVMVGVSSFGENFVQFTKHNAAGVAEGGRTFFQLLGW